MPDRQVGYAARRSRRSAATAPETSAEDWRFYAKIDAIMEDNNKPSP
jgi:hypothetical protein